MCAACLGLAALPGCGESLPSVTGTVTLDGAPLSRGTLTFHPADGGAVGYAAIRPDGTFSASQGATPGLPPGEYKVTISAFEPLPPSTKENPFPTARRLVPERYGDVRTTDQKVTVTAEGENVFDLALKSQ